MEGCQDDELNGVAGGTVDMGAGSRRGRNVKCVKFWKTTDGYQRQYRTSYSVSVHGSRRWIG
jgi:hypothetical protein